MSPVEAVSIVHELPPALHRQAGLPDIPREYLQISAMRISLVLQEVADSLDITLDHRHASPEEPDPAADLIVCVVKAVHPHCFQRIGQIMLDGRAYAIQIVSLTPVPDEDWLTRHADTEISFLHAERTDGGILLPQPTPPQRELHDRVHTQHVNDFTEEHAAAVLQKAAKLRETFGRNF